MSGPPTEIIDSYLDLPPLRSISTLWAHGQAPPPVLHQRKSRRRSPEVHLGNSLLSKGDLDVRLAPSRQGSQELVPKGSISSREGQRGGFLGGEIL